MFIILFKKIYITASFDWTNKTVSSNINVVKLKKNKCVFLYPKPTYCND